MQVRGCPAPLKFLRLWRRRQLCLWFHGLKNDRLRGNPGNRIWRQRYNRHVRDGSRRRFRCSRRNAGRYCGPVMQWECLWFFPRRYRKEFLRYHFRPVWWHIWSFRVFSCLNKPVYPRKKGEGRRGRRPQRRLCLLRGILRRSVW